MVNASQLVVHKLWFGVVITKCMLVAVGYFTGIPDSKVYGANMGPTWGPQDPRGPYIGPMDLAIWHTYWTNQGGALHW